LGNEAEIEAEDRLLLVPPWPESNPVQPDEHARVEQQIGGLVQAERAALRSMKKYLLRLQSRAAPPTSQRSLGAGKTESPRGAKNDGAAL
jgi:hypothetical protein